MYCEKMTRLIKKKSTYRIRILTEQGLISRKIIQIYEIAKPYNILNVIIHFVITLQHLYNILVLTKSSIRDCLFTNLSPSFSNLYFSYTLQLHASVLVVYVFCIIFSQKLLLSIGKP